MIRLSERIERNTSRMWVWLASLLFYIYVYGFCCFVRWILHKSIPHDPNEQPWFAAILEILGTLQTIAPFFDVDIVWETYGIVAVFFQLFLFEYLNWRTIYDAFANPCYLFTAKTTATLNRQWIPWLAAGQLLGALLSWPMVMLFWKFSFADEHDEAFDTMRHDCEHDLTLSVLNGCIVECLGAFAVRYFELNTQEHARTALINSVVCSLMTCLGLYLTGFYIHPFMASALTLGCGDLTVWKHFKVYWVSPVVGWYAAELVYAVKTEPPRLKHSYEIKYTVKTEPPRIKKIGFD